jgi:vancomycin resistance protein YoaR
MIAPGPPHGEDATPPPRVPTHRRGRGFGIFAIALVAAGASALLYVRSLGTLSTARGLHAGGIDIGGVDFQRLDERIASLERAYLARPLSLSLGGEVVTATRREAGLMVNRVALKRALVEAGKSGNPLVDVRIRARARRGLLDLPVPVTVDRSRALDFLSDVKDRLDRPALDAKLDLEHHGVAPEQLGLLVQIYQSLVNLEYAARGVPDQVELAGIVTPPQVTRDSLSQIDISHVLGAWQTRYSMAVVDSDRTYNLKVGAGKVDGTVIQPHQVFSFNQVTGDRTEKEGYRVAPVIQAGELVDGLAGGMCQIASTLHAASWFAGIDILESTPHSRPSAYITMGMDSTVVYPTTDLKLRNPYDFPVVIHYQVNQGYVRAEVLGKPRPPGKIAFEREILHTIGFTRETRNDPNMPTGQQVLDQEGHAGYRIKRRRVFFSARPEAPTRLEERQVSYPATTEIVRVGTGPSSLPKKPQPPSHHIAAPEKPNVKGGIFRIVK